MDILGDMMGPNRLCRLIAAQFRLEAAVVGEKDDRPVVWLCAPNIATLTITYACTGAGHNALHFFDGALEADASRRGRPTCSGAGLGHSHSLATSRLKLLITSNGPRPRVQLYSQDFEMRFAP